MVAIAVPGLAAAVVIGFVPLPPVGLWSVLGVATLLTALAVVRGHQTTVRPLLTLANLLGALRRGDVSMRAAHAREDDPLGAVLTETNALAETLRSQRLGAIEANALLRKVMAEIDVAVFAFDEDAALRLVNRAGERLLGSVRERVEGSRAADLGLAEFLEGEAPRVVELRFPGASGRGELRRGRFRQSGRTHTLLVVADLSRALRQEELTAWRRLVRVLSHEINNSLAPIASAANSLQRLVARAGLDADTLDDVKPALSMIESRAQSLARFIRAYARLARLPAPTRAEVELAPLVRRVANLETRRPVNVEDGPDVTLEADRDQLEQLLINLVRNAVDALEDDGAATGGVRVGWRVVGSAVTLHVTDDGPGLGATANLFVPFFSTKPNGSGIGLALCRQIAEGHGGSLELEDRPDGPGARATVRLPVRPAPGPD